MRKSKSTPYKWYGFFFARAELYMFVFLCFYVIRTVQTMKPYIHELLKSEDRKTNIVGVIGCREDLDMALANPNLANCYEWRMDLAANENIFPPGISRLRLKNRAIILTARDPLEGGLKPTDRSGTFNLEERVSFMKLYLGITTFLDIEAVNVPWCQDLMQQAQRVGVGIIVSRHAINRMMSMGEVLAAISAYKAADAQILKIVSHPPVTDDHSGAEQWSAFSSAVIKICRSYDVNLALMATGERFARSSRISAVLEKMPFVYGYLAKPAAPGQPSVTELRGYIDPPVAVYSAVEEAMVTA